MAVLYGLIDAGWQAVAQAVRLPGQRECAVGLCLQKFGIGKRVVVLGLAVRWPCDSTPDELDLWLVAKCGSRMRDQRVLAGVARADHSDESPVADRQGA